MISPFVMLWVIGIAFMLVVLFVARYPIMSLGLGVIAFLWAKGKFDDRKGD